MAFRRCGFWVGAVLLAAAPALRTGEAAPPPPDAPPLMPPAGKKFDPWKLPSDSLLEITPEKLQELLEEARLKSKVKLPPTKCRLGGGEVQDGFALFRAEFEFHAERPDAVFALACGQAKVKAAQQEDGRTPMLSSDADGYLVQVEKPGDYKVTLDLAAPLTQRPGGGRGFELDLPRAVVAYLEMKLPDDARAPRLNGKDAAEKGLTWKEHRLEGALGVLDKLDLTWEGPPPAGVGPLRTAHGRVTVRIDGDAMTTEAELVLHAQGEPVAEWMVVVPPGYDVRASAADQARVKSLTRGGDMAGAAYTAVLQTGADLLRDLVPNWPGQEVGGVAYTVVLNEASGEDLTLTATARTSLAGGQRAVVGPFLVRGAARQSGVVLVSARGPDAHPLLSPKADLTPHNVTDEERAADPGLIAAYDYGAAPALPWLDVEAGSAGGAVKTRAAYTLTLGRTGPGGGLEWQATAAFTVLGRNGVDRLDVQLPPDCEYVPSAQPDPAATIQPDDANPQLLRVHFTGAPTGSFTVSVKARYTAPVSAPQRAQPAAIPLPRPSVAHDAQDGGAQIDVTVPDEFELLPPADAEGKDPHKFTWRSAKTPDQANFSWQPYTPEAHVSSVIDLTFRGQTAEVQHELHLHFPRTAPKQLTLKTPAALGASLQVVSGGVLADDPPPAPETRVLKLQGAGPDQVVTLKYSFPVTGPPVPVALTGVESARDGDARVRVWCGPGRLPLPPGGDWSQLDIEEVKGVNRLPVLVLGSMRPDAPLTLTFRDPAAAANVLVDRALYRAALENDAWEVRVSYLLRQPADANLDIELPDSPSALRLRATLDGREVDPETVEQADPARHVARLRLGGDLFLKPAVLDLTYKLPTQRAFFNVLTPPRLVGDPGDAPTRWQVTLPPDCVALAPECGAAARWAVGLRLGCLPAPRLAVTNDDLEQWFAGADVPSWPKGSRVAPSLVCWQDAGRPLTVAYLPEWGWMALCSVPLVLLGLLLFFLARRSYAGRRWAAVLLWSILALLAPVLAAAWVFFPTLLYAVAFGCEPGAAVLLLFLLVQAVMLERYRRRIVFLPNFRRARTGSSMVRTNGSNRPAGEPSTVDAPRAAGSSQQPAER